ncbi:hypothetical protein Hanom_Chr11g01044401 [Helianthus anomalus]
MFVTNFRRCPLPLKLMSFVLNVSKSCTLCPLRQTQLNFFLLNLVMCLPHEDILVISCLQGLLYLDFCGGGFVDGEDGCGGGFVMVDAVVGFSDSRQRVGWRGEGVLSNLHFLPLVVLNLSSAAKIINSLNL